MSAIDFNKAAYFPLEGSYRETNNATRLGDLDPRMPISVTLLWRRHRYCAKQFLIPLFYLLL